MRIENTYGVNLVIPRTKPRAIKLTVENIELIREILDKDEGTTYGFILSKGKLVSVFIDGEATGNAGDWLVLDSIIMFFSDEDFRSEFEIISSSPFNPEVLRGSKS